MKKRDEAFEFRCYDVVQKAAEPISVKSLAEQVRTDVYEVRRVLDRLERQKALSRKRLRGVWHYFV
jgi:predicted ArsR family transcriptional regulator